MRISAWLVRLKRNATAADSGQVSHRAPAAMHRPRAFSDSPWTLRLYAIGFIVIVWGDVPFNHGGAQLTTFLSAFLLTLMGLFFVVRGSRVAWTIFLLLELGALSVNVALGP